MCKDHDASLMCILIQMQLLCDAHLDTNLHDDSILDVDFVWWSLACGSD